MRIFITICRFRSDFIRLLVVLMESSILLWQFGQRSIPLIRTLPVNLVRLDVHSPNFSFTELVILPNTSLVFSGIVTGSIVLKIIVLEAAWQASTGTCSMGWILHSADLKLHSQGSTHRLPVSSAIVAEAIAILSALLAV